MTVHVAADRNVRAPVRPPPLHFRLHFVSMRCYGAMHPPPLYYGAMHPLNERLQWLWGAKRISKSPSRTGHKRRGATMVSMVMSIVKSKNSCRRGPCCGLKTRAPWFGQDARTEIALN